MTKSELKLLIRECINEVINPIYIITGTVNSDLDVAGIKYKDGDNLVTHGELQSRYGIKGNDWRYRNDINTIMWWGNPDEDEKQAVEDWLRKKYSVKNPKSLKYGGGQDDIKTLFHYPKPKSNIWIQ